MQERYITTDRAIEILRKKTIRRFEKAKSSIRLAKFDELHVIKTVATLYKNLDSDLRDTMLELAFAIYEEIGEEVSRYGYKDIGKISAKAKKALVETVLSSPNSVTKYEYENEVLRKRDRLSEALRTRSDVNSEWRRAVSLWSNMTAQYADIVTDETVLRAYKDAGVEYVMWVTQEDEKVCEICKPLDGEIFPINEAPDKQHWHCRCYLVPIERK